MAEDLVRVPQFSKTMVQQNANEGALPKINVRDGYPLMNLSQIET